MQCGMMCLGLFDVLWLVLVVGWVAVGGGVGGGGVDMQCDLGRWRRWQHGPRRSCSISGSLLCLGSLLTSGARHT